MDPVSGYQGADLTGRAHVDGGSVVLEVSHLEDSVQFDRRTGGNGPHALGISGSKYGVPSKYAVSSDHHRAGAAVGV